MRPAINRRTRPVDISPPSLSRAPPKRTGQPAPAVLPELSPEACGSEIVPAQRRQNLSLAPLFIVMFVSTTCRSTSGGAPIIAYA